MDLGLVPPDSPAPLPSPAAAGDTLDGQRPQSAGSRRGFQLAPAAVRFAVELRRARGIERAVELLDADFERVNFARAEIGARGRSLETLEARLEDEDVQLRVGLSDEIDTDLADAISNLTARQAALEASLRLPPRPSAVAARLPVVPAIADSAAAGVPMTIRRDSRPPELFDRSMRVPPCKSTRIHFGPVEIEVDDILLFPHGVIAFEDCRHWVLLADDENDALGWLQSVTRGEVAVPVVSPRRFAPEYQVHVTRGQLAPLELSHFDQAYVLSVVSQSDGDLTLNLKAPLIINLDRRLGRQVITTDEQPVALATADARGRHASQECLIQTARSEKVCRLRKEVILGKACLRYFSLRPSKESAGPPPEQNTVPTAHPLSAHPTAADAFILRHNLPACLIAGPARLQGRSHRCWFCRDTVTKAS